MKIQYVGPHDAVEVPDAGVVAQRDVPVEIKDAVAKRLLEQDVWAEPASKPTKGKE